MAEITIEDSEEPVGEELAEHDAAKAVGAAEVHEEMAEEAAAEAAEAAVVAEEAAMVNAASVGVAEEAALRAEESATAAMTGAEAVAEAIRAQTLMLNSFMEEVRLARESGKGDTEPKKPVEKKPDRAPANKPNRRGGWYYGR